MRLHVLSVDIQSEQALSIDPINPHILELLNTALESSTMTVPTNKMVDTEFKKTIKLLKAKYARHKGKEKASDAPSEAAQSDEMSIG